MSYENSNENDARMRMMNVWQSDSRNQVNLQFDGKVFVLYAINAVGGPCGTEEKKNTAKTTSTASWEKKQQRQKKKQSYKQTIRQNTHTHTHIEQKKM